MVRTNLQEFAGDVHVLSNLQVGSNLFANDLAANVLNVIGSIGANLFVGDGGLLSNIATTLDDIIDQGNTVSNTIIFVSGNDATSNTGIITRSNVGISISNTEPTGEYQLTVGSNIFVNTHASNVLTVVGRIGSDYFVGDGGLLSNIATTLDQIVDQGNTISNTVILESGQDSALTSNIGLVSRENVGISVSNSNPTGEFQFGVGSNLFVNTYSSNVLTVEGNVLAQKLTFGTATVTSAYNLSHVTAQGSVTDQTISLTNATTGLAVTSNATVGGNVTAETVISTANVEVGDRLKFASNVFVDDLRVADVAANLVTYDKTTGELMDSGGLFANKLAVVSVQPPSALSANTTTIAKHGTYTVTTSSLAANSNAWNAFDGDSAVEWLGSTTSDHVYNGGAGTYSGTSNLFAGNYIQPGVSSAGEWLAVEFPYKTTLRHMKLTPPATYQQYPASANVYATNDSLTWAEVVNWSDVNPGDQQSNVQTIIVNATESYKKYAMVVTKTNGSDTNTALAEWKLFTESFSIDGGKVAMATSAVMGGETTVDQHGPHSRDPKAVPLKKYPEIVFDASKMDGNDSTNTYVQAGYTVTTNGDQSSRHVWYLYDDNDATRWHATGATLSSTGSSNSVNPITDTNSTVHQGVWTTLELPNKVKVKHILVRSTGNLNNDDRRFKSGKLFGGNDNSTFNLIGTFESAASTIDVNKFDIDSDTSYKYITFLCDKVWAGTSLYMHDLKFYGYEELATQGDTSVDTTFTSIMNTPQTTGANVYIDGNLGETLTNRVTGPDATGPSATYDATGKYWELNGSLESNIAVEANTFLSGDQPHAVSVWFNSSNLEANVSNTCVFSVSDQEKLDSVNLDLQSNTWHNLTYAYQGEGGSRVTYLDGRKVAEDQAEDTFGKYPPFAMTGYAQGGYVVSASSEYSSTYQQWEPYGEGGTDAANSWISGPTQNYFGSGTGATGEAYTSGANVADTTVIDGVTTYGEWSQVEFPEKLHLSSVALNGINSTDAARYPKDAIVCASIDGITWTSIGSWTGEVNRAEDNIKHYTLNSTKSFKYVRIVVTKISTGYDGLTMLSRVRYYGHRENDLVRLPDPTNVLKYPHIAMTGPAQRGYVASASDTHNTVITNNGGPWQAFDGTITQVTTEGWVSPNSRYSNDAAGSTAVNGVANSFNGRDGEWLNIKLPHKITLSSFETFVRMDRDHEHPTSGYLYASNDGFATFQEIYSFTDVAVPGEVNGKVTHVIPSSHLSVNLIPYNEYRLQVTKLEGASGLASIAELKLFGTGVDSVPIQIGGGNIDKVANFRVYDKFVGEDQALEIWDAQKDAFRGVKNSMTLHKGRLGIGTTEPEGRLAVLDEPHNLEEFPPRAMTGYKNYFEGHGEFCVSASSYFDLNNYPGWEVFNHTGTSNNYDAWLSADSIYTLNTNVDVDPSVAANINGVYGEWLELKLPYKIILDRLAIKSRGALGNTYGYTSGPGAGNVWGSNDGVNWTLLSSFTGFTYKSLKTSGAIETLHVNSITPYSYFRLQPTKRVLQNPDYTPDSYVAIGELRYFGTREQGQSVLHDGQLTLTKSLNVPRIGPALDADDTPRRDRLVVEYNTSTNPTSEGAVRDTSGRGNDGVFINGASYDATNKALEFDGNQYIQGDTGLTGNFTHSISMWFNANNDGQLFWTGINSSSGDRLNILFSEDGGYGGNTTTPQIHYTFKGHTHYANVNPNQWHHLVCTYSGTDSSSRKIYIDGVPVGSDTATDGTGDTTHALNIQTSTFYLNKTNYGNGILVGSISNFKLYDCALTAEEVKTLYDMGRCDEGHHVVNFSKTRVGIGLGDGEAPSAALGVRGGATFRGGNVGINTSVVNESPLTLQCDLGGLRGLRIVRASGSGHWEITNQVYNDLVFTGSSGGYGVLTNVTNVGTIDFTGQHRNFIDGIPYGEYQTLEGLIVSANKNKYYDIDENITAGANAIQISQSLPLVALSNVVHDKACFGVVAGAEDPETRKYDQGMFSTVIPKQRGDTRVYINSLGEGAIWVVNTNGSLESGDYITTSNVAGYGQKQDSEFLANYTVAKITMDCDFEPATQPVQQILRSNVVETYYLGNVHKVKNVPHEFVTTVVGADDAWSNVSVSPSDVTYAEWSNLEANTQNTYTLTYTQTSNVVYDVKYTKTTTANVTESDSWDKVFVDPPTVTYAEWSNLEANTQNTYTLTYTQTTTDEKTPDEWSTLESNVQSLYNKVYYQSVEEEVAKDYPGAVAHTRVTDVIENELDEHGQIQWEDHPTETEKAYKIRYLDANGVETDEASHVYKAAFVGCTYHCG
jgi:hypothetical protein